MNDCIHFTHFKCLHGIENILNKYIVNRRNYTAFYQVWLPAVKAKGLEISGTFSRRQGHMYMDMTFTNKALQHMTDFAVQFNKNRLVRPAGKVLFLHKTSIMFGCCIRLF